MPAIDPSHWLYRLDAPQWLAAADTELARSRAALVAKQHRPGLAHARRAAGMALNAVLFEHFDERYGRSYVDHLRALGDDDTASADARESAQLLMATPIQQPALVTLGAQGSTDLADAAARIVDYARRLVATES